MTGTIDRHGRDGFQHLLAFGNSDQASFRRNPVRDSFDIMTVPGTIASYYEEATAAFVLSSDIRYLIDPRTPLFQDRLEAPRASHFTLAAWHGNRVTDQLHAARDGVAEYPVAFWTPTTVAEMVQEVVARQRGYAEGAPRVTKKLERYAQLLAKALAQDGAPPAQGDPQAPSAILAPYFAVRGLDDPWWRVMESVWDACRALADPVEIRPVVCVDIKHDADVLARVIDNLPEGLSLSAFFWITGFDERQAPEGELRAVWDVVAHASSRWRLTNLYGSFFSIAMRYAGLAGFGNGLTYSESRAWPALASTGSAPPRYYVRDLHAFMGPAAAADLVRVDPSFACPCEACTALAASGRTLASMEYHDLKLHFALARTWELETTAVQSRADTAAQLREAGARASLASGRLPGRVPWGHLTPWANVIGTS